MDLPAMFTEALKNCNTEFPKLFQKIERQRQYYKARITLTSKLDKEKSRKQ